MKSQSSRCSMADRIAKKVNVDESRRCPATAIPLAVALGLRVMG
jgi:hypothetical protein